MIAGSNLEKLADLVPSELLDESGKVFYSGRAAFEQKAALYLIGCNPGGNPEMHPGETVRSNIELVRSAIQPWSAYLDEDWHGGASLMRKSVPHLASQLGFDLRTIPASNLLFVRSETMAKLGKSPNIIEDHCWFFHAELISRLEPRIVVCMGFTDTGPRTRKRLMAKEPVKLASATPDQVRVFRTRDGLIVADVRHPSRYWDWTNPKYDPSEGLRELLETN
jgi:hypothetical protein